MTIQISRYQNWSIASNDLLAGNNLFCMFEIFHLRIKTDLVFSRAFPKNGPYYFLFHLFLLCFFKNTSDVSYKRTWHVWTGICYHIVSALSLWLWEAKRQKLTLIILDQVFWLKSGFPSNAIATFHGKSEIRPFYWFKTFLLLDNMNEIRMESGAFEVTIYCSWTEMNLMYVQEIVILKYVS